jgi:hypothetical protein
MVNTSPWDFELQDYVSAAKLKSMLVTKSCEATERAVITNNLGSGKLLPPVLPASMGWQPFKLNNAEKDLLQYCK